MEEWGYLLVALIGAVVFILVPLGTLVTGVVLCIRSPGIGVGALVCFAVTAFLWGNLVINIIRDNMDSRKTDKQLSECS